MTKVIKSQSKVWSGSVHIADPMTMPMVKLVEDVLDSFLKDKDGDKVIYLSIVDEAMLPAIVACVEKWELSNFPDTVTPETFPATPRKESHELIKWLFSEIYRVFIGETEIPNG